MSVKRKEAASPRAESLGLGAAIRCGLARASANRHLFAYLYQPDPSHIAKAWIEFRKAGVAPDKAMLRWMDRLAADVQNPRPARVRPKKNTVRDLEIYRLVRAMQKSPSSDDDPFTAIARDRKLTKRAVQMIVGRVEKALGDPYYRPRAYIE